jgi:flagellar basal-body rod protein FlgB
MNFLLLLGPVPASLPFIMLEAMTANLEKYMDLLSARQKLSASNIANADTPGYQTKDIDFQQEFMSMVNGQQPQTINAGGLTDKPDGNNVNVDREARMLAENAMRFNVASNLLRGQINSVKEAITGGTS